MPDTSLPTEYCDIVMKGGVTSGVVYPMAVVELAQRYAFKNIGGTSAGAIAAAVTAAAERRRRSGSLDGFEALGQLPSLLSRDGFLLSLFAPDHRTRPLFRTLLAVTQSQGPIMAALRIWRALVLGYLAPALLGGSLGMIVPLVLWLAGKATGPGAFALGSLWVFAGITLAALLASAKTLPELLRRNRYGLCSGYRRGGSMGDPPLVNWLYGYLNDVAGLSPNQPLTFRHLHEARRCNDVTLASRVINLEMMTTNLTHGRPFRLPFSDEDGQRFYFSPKEWEEFFPEVVIESLKRDSAGEDVPTTHEGLELCPLPTVDLPVIVAVRLSLSFPGLFSAVPLWAVDFTLKANQNLASGSRPVAERCWFSDGGLSSNFPIHFFDAPIPRWPTFGVNLKDPHPDFRTREEDFVWLPTTNGGGVQPRWNRFDMGSAATQIGGFIGAVIDSMQSWRDNLAARMPGYRNRIVHISQTAEEGGLNLGMAPDIIKRLSARGQRAGRLLRTEFDFKNHVWVRYRSYTAALSENIAKFADAYRNPVPQDAVVWPLIRGSDDPSFPSYPMTLEKYRELIAFTAEAVGLAESGRSASHEAPRPRPELRMVPKV